MSFINFCFFFLRIGMSFICLMMGLEVIQALNYNPGDYQTAGGYPSSSYTHQTTTWNRSNSVSFTTQLYSNYSQDSSGAYAAGTEMDLYRNCYQSNARICLSG
ncbi:hypothetical protein GOBAR_AA03682 [Gossypium barbadense]|uniref:Uncharacterized protein n=4 Tax=Gossypium TaxID=3633 RepID=A0A2P5YMT7_GOSBA|nr:hypothetical protein GOBAR_AA03682 [Gossypium barbadense]